MRGLAFWRQYRDQDNTRIFENTENIFFKFVFNIGLEHFDGLSKKWRKNGNQDFSIFC